jgi:uncharacterized membrane protein
MPNFQISGGSTVTRFAYSLLVGVVGAGIVHIAILFMLPYFTERDAWGQLTAKGELYETVRIQPDGGITLDPLFEAVACRFDLADGPVHIAAPGKIPFWSISIYDRGGRNIFSLNERLAVGGELDIVILTPVQMLDLRNEFPADFERSVFVEAEIDAGIALVRSFVPDTPWEPRISAYLEGVVCTTG